MQVYGFSNLVVLVNGYEITGWSKGDDVIKIARRAEAATDEVGADGKMMVSVSADKSGSFTFKLQQTSPSNSFLMKLLTAMELTSANYAPVAVKVQDMYRNDLAAGALGYISKIPDMNRGEKATEQEWTINVENLVLVFGEKILSNIA